MSYEVDLENDSIYKLSKICIDDTDLDNILLWLRLRNELAEKYNQSSEMDKELKAVWLQNVLIVTSSIIESFMFSGLKRLTYMVTRSKKTDIAIKLVPILNKYTKDDIFTYKKIIDDCKECGLFEYNEEYLNEIRKLRNGIHIHSNEERIADISSYDNANTISKTIEISIDVANQLAMNLERIEDLLRD